MKRQSHIETEPFDRAVSDAFQGDSDCGAFGAIDDLKRRRMINDILVAAKAAKPSTDVETGMKRRAYRPFIIGTAAAIVTFCVFGALFWKTTGAARRDARAAPQETYFGEVREQEGNVYIGDTRAVVNAPVPVGNALRTAEGTAMLRLPTGIEWRMERHTHAKIASLDASHLNIILLSGESWFRVDPMRKGPAIAVNTPRGRIEVTGTIFVVTTDPAEVRVTLLKGEVWVTHPSGRRELVKTGYTMRLGEGKQHPLGLDERNDMQGRLARLDWQTGASPVVAGEPTDAIDEKDRRPEPMVASSSSTGASAEKAAPGTILEEIQNHRKSGNWGRVAMLYKRLIQSAPGGETAIVSRVSLGEIYLTKLREYQSALHQFDKYLRSGHTALLPEALYGRCKALKALGQQDQERQCLERFTRQFTSALQVTDARARLNLLRGRDRI